MPQERVVAAFLRHPDGACKITHRDAGMSCHETLEFMRDLGSFFPFSSGGIAARHGMSRTGLVSLCPA